MNDASSSSAAPRQHDPTLIRPAGRDSGDVLHRRLIVLGSTGSIGGSTLEVVAHLNRLCCSPPPFAGSPAVAHAPGRCFSIVGLAAGRNVERLLEQAIRFRVPYLAILDPAAGATLAERLRGGYGPLSRGRSDGDAMAASLGPVDLLDARVRETTAPPVIFTGPDAARELVEAVEADVLIGAITGAAGLPATLAAIDRGLDIALANKETLVAAGDLVIPAARRRGVALLPVDSEHSALFQCLQAAEQHACRQRPATTGADGRGRPEAIGGDRLPTGAGGVPAAAAEHPTPAPGLDQVCRLVLTASGGPFRTWSREAIAEATVEAALNHPTWDMGAKVTIDSASMTNKALELLEAQHLFDLGSDDLEVVVHPQSIIHGLIEFHDGSVLAQLGLPDMKAPIQYALTYPDRLPGCSPRIDWRQMMQLTFEPPDQDRFPALRLIREVMSLGGNAGAIFNAANEAAVEAFLTRRIAFGSIARLTEGALRAVSHGPVRHLDDVIAADREARSFVEGTIDRG